MIATHTSPSRDSGGEGGGGGGGGGGSNGCGEMLPTVGVGARRGFCSGVLLIGSTGLKPEGRKGWRRRRREGGVVY